MTKLKYMQLVQSYTQSMIHNAEEQKFLTTMKTLKEKKQEEVETLRRKLKRNERHYNNKRAETKYFSCNKNDESKFQTLLSQALSEKNALKQRYFSKKLVR